MDKKDLILKSALGLFASNGYKQTSTLSIAEKAGVSEGLVFKHYKSKEKLLGEVMKRGLRQMEESMASYKDSKDPVHAIHAHIEKVFEMMKKDPSYWKLIYRIKFQITEIKSLHMLWKQFHGEMLNTISANFKKTGVKKCKEEAFLFIASIEGLSANYLQHPKEYPVDNLIKALKDKYSKDSI
jgi:AcrR family transcriptional regulator